MNVYTRIGGASAVHVAVDLFYERVLADDRLVGYFDLDRMDALREHQRAFLTTALGGPTRYRGRSMSEAHAGLAIAPEHFDAVVEHLVATLTELGVAPDVIEGIGALLLPLKAEVAPAPVAS